MYSIDVKDLAFGYKRQILSDSLNLKIHSGDYILVLGENGTGKSTLIKTLLGLLKPLGGEVVLNGLNKEDIGYLPQLFSLAPDFPATVYEVVISGNRPNFLCFYTKSEKKKCLEALQNFGILDLKERAFSKLSGGQQEKVLLARAFVSNKKVLILDEPVTGLDDSARENMYKLINDLNKSGTTIIMISHDTTDALKYASHVLKLGANFYFGKKEDYENGTL